MILSWALKTLCGLHVPYKSWFLPISKLGKLEKMYTKIGILNSQIFNKEIRHAKTTQIIFKKIW